MALRPRAGAREAKCPLGVIPRRGNQFTRGPLTSPELTVGHRSLRIASSQKKTCRIKPRPSRQRRKAAAEHAAIIPVALLFAGPLRVLRCLPAGTALAYPSDWKRAARGRAAATVPALSVLAPAALRAHCLRRRYAMYCGNRAVAVTPFQPMTKPHHIGRRRNGRARFRLASDRSADRVDSGAWRGRGARWPGPARRGIFSPIRCKTKP